MKQAVGEGRVMSTMTETTDQSTNTTPPAVVASAVKLRRRPLLMVVAAALIVAGGGLGALLWSSATTNAEVVIVRASVERGEVIAAEDLATVRVTLDPALQTVPGSGLPDLVGKRAAADLAVGTLLAPSQVTDMVVPATGESMVGIAVAPGLLPSEPLRPGDAVRLVQTPGAGGEVTGKAAPFTIDATVVSVTQGDAQTIVNVVLPSTKAPDLAARAATGKIAVVLDSRVR